MSAARPDHYAAADERRVCPGERGSNGRAYGSAGEQRVVRPASPVAHHHRAAGYRDQVAESQPRIEGERRSLYRLSLESERALHRHANRHAQHTDRGVGADYVREPPSVARVHSKDERSIRAIDGDARGQRATDCVAVAHVHHDADVVGELAREPVVPPSIPVSWLSHLWIQLGAGQMAWRAEFEEKKRVAARQRPTTPTDLVGQAVRAADRAVPRLLRRDRTVRNEDAGSDGNREGVPNL